MDILVLFLIITISYRFEYRKNGQYEDYLSKEYCTCLKGICALFILFHHISQNTNSFGLLWNRFPLVGGMTVSVFFFLSAYGLYRSTMQNAHYLKCFWAKRLPSLLIPYLLVSMLYFVVRNILGTSHSVSFSDFIKNLFGPDSIVTFSWFVTALLLFYVIFYTAARLALPSYHVSFALLVLTGTTIYYVVCVLLGFSHWWYLSAYAFPLGFFYAMKENSILRILNRHFFPVCFVCLLLFVSTFLAAIFFPVREEYNFLSATLFQTAYIIFPLCVVFSGRKFRFRNKILFHLGALSFEIYLLQGLIMLLLRNDSLWIRNDFLFALLVMGFSIAGAALLHRISYILLSAMCHK